MANDRPNVGRAGQFLQTISEGAGGIAALAPNRRVANA